jgi:WD40 repeat protein
MVVALILAWSTPGAGPPKDSNLTDRDLIRVREEAEKEPWLRINAGGHVGSVRALAFLPDSSRLCSAGLDKTVQVWNLKAAFRDIRRVFLRERTIRWQVARGLRGAIYALAAAPSDGLLAVGGYGATGSAGDVALFNPVDGSLERVLEQHRQTIMSLAFSPDGNWLASSDLSGRAVVWNRDGWQPTTLRQPDRDVYGAETAALIERLPRLRPIVFAGKEHVVLPAVVGKPTETQLQWKLLRIRLADPSKQETLDAVHSGVVTALAATPDGTRLASADLAGNLYLWDLRRAGQPTPLAPGGPVASLAFDPKGETLVVGTAIPAGKQQSELQLWDVATGRVRRRKPLADHVHACAVSPDGQTLAYSGGQSDEVFVEPLDDGDPVVPLRGKGERVLKVAFAKERPLYRVALGTHLNERGFNDYADLEMTFDPMKLELDAAEPPRATDWLSSDWRRGDWEAKWRSSGSLQLYRSGRPQGTITLDPNLGGTPRAYCWIPDRDGNPFAVAVGTDTQNGIFVYRLASEGECPLLRHLRGHQDYVTSVGVSRDLQYLVSGSADGTVRFWSLEGYDQPASTLRRWGAGFAVRGGRLVVQSLHQAGPLFRKGVRRGDVVTEIVWNDGQQVVSETRAAAILQRLNGLPWTTQVVFKTARDGASRPPFQRLAAWEPLASLFVSTDRQWAFWTPEGYYDASLGGHTLFGWQVNRGFDAKPRFYRADQFRKRFERPEVMRRLLEAGSLQTALGQAQVRPPAETHVLLPQQISVTPEVSILSPLPDAVLDRGDTQVTARIRMPEAGNLVRAKVFANGVVATRRRLVSQRKVEGGTELTYSWDVALPADERNLIQLRVATDAPTAAFDNVLVERALAADEPARRPPKLYVLAVGINEYRDSNVPQLSFSVADAEAMVDLLKTHSKGIYAMDEVAILTNKQVTPESWREALADLSKKLAELASPDDLLVLFLAGHGIVDDQTQEYYFLGHDFGIDDLEKRAYNECISWSDFQSLADVPCRKLALLDTCHSGAVQPLRSYHLKAAVRALEEDVIFTVTASAGHERAAENKKWGHGVFTKCLLEALEGRADDSRDGVVTLDEAVVYVSTSVSEVTERRQNPTAGPEEVLRFTSLPLTRPVAPPSEEAAIAPRNDHPARATGGSPGSSG